MRKLKQTKRFFLILLVGVLVYSCSQDEQIDSKIESEQSENFVNLNKASDIASVIQYPLPVNTNYKSLKAKRVTSMPKVIESITKVPDEDGNTSYYIVNYENDGFLLLAADMRVNPVLAFSNTGKFLLDTNQYPNGLVEWLVNTKDVIKDVRENNLELSDEMKKLWNIENISSAIISKSNENKIARTQSIPDWCYELEEDDIDDYPECQETCQNSYTTVGPLLSTSWGQWGGYNDLAPNLGCNGDGRAPTGCVATAMAQIMNYYEFPNNYNWENMPNSWGTMETARLMRDVGDAVGMDWGCNGSSADTKDETASSFKNDFSYSSATYKDYALIDYNLIKTQINQSKPVILRGGRNTGWWIFGVYSDGHAWVCDGYRSVFFCGVGTYLYLHMNWGWSGTHNGYYSFNNWSPGNNTFNYKKGIVYNITP